MSKRHVEVDEKLLLSLPLGVIVSSLTLIVGGAIWLHAVYAQGKENSDLIQKVSNKQDAYESDLDEIKRTLARIEGELHACGGHERGL